MKVSLYIPCFNAQETIRPCLEAVLKQEYLLKEVLVVDDGSSDKTIKIVSEYPVKIIRHKANKGLAAARNTAIKNLKADFVASLDADCVPEPDWLECLMGRFNSPKIAGVGGKLLEAYSSSVFDIWRSVHMRQYWKDKERSPPFLFGSNSVFCKKVLINIGCYDERFKNNYEDVDICSRLKKAGYSLAYVPKAQVKHLKSDDICSLLNTYWRWNLGYYEKGRYYSNLKRFVFKIKDNLGLANRYLEEDIAAHRDKLIYLDFLLGLHHSLRDFECYIFQDNQEKHNLDSRLPLWLSLVDLTFFYHYGSTKNNISTLMPKRNIFLQNFLALNLILGGFIQKNFKNTKFRKILYKHLFLSIYGIDDIYLLDKLLNLVELHQDWQAVLKKKHLHINKPFLENLFLNLQEWLKNMVFRFPNIIQAIENSAEVTDRLSFISRGGL